MGKKIRWNFVVETFIQGPDALIDIYIINLGAWPWDGDFFHLKQANWTPVVNIQASCACGIFNRHETHELSMALVRFHLGVAIRSVRTRYGSGQIQEGQKPNANPIYLLMGSKFQT